MSSFSSFSTASPDQQDTVSFSVNLKKKSRGRGRSSIGNLTTNQQLRTFMLRGSILSYYSDEDGRTKKGDINLSGAVISKSSTKSSLFRSNIFGFEILTEDNETIFLEASSADVRDKCIQEFSVAAKSPSNLSFFSPGNREVLGEFGPGSLCIVPLSNSISSSLDLSVTNPASSVEPSSITVPDFIPRGADYTKANLVATNAINLDNQSNQTSEVDGSGNRSSHLLEVKEPSILPTKEISVGENKISHEPMVSTDGSLSASFAAATVNLTATRSKSTSPNVVTESSKTDVVTISPQANTAGALRQHIPTATSKIFPTLEKNLNQSTPLKIRSSATTVSPTTEISAASGTLLSGPRIVASDESMNSTSKPILKESTTAAATATTGQVHTTRSTTLSDGKDLPLAGKDTVLAPNSDLEEKSPNFADRRTNHGSNVVNSILMDQPQTIMQRSLLTSSASGVRSNDRKSDRSNSPEQNPPEPHDNQKFRSKARSVKSRDEEMRPVARYMNAAKEGNLQAVKAILENELKVELVDVTDEYDDKKETALIYACMNGHLGVVEYLLSQGASVKYRSIAGGNATLFAAGAKGKDALRCLQLCIDNGGDITSATHRLRTPLWLSAFNGADETMAYIVGLEKVDLNKPNREGMTPLIIATINGHVKCVQLLIKAGADLNIKMPNGWSAIAIAKSLHKSDCLHLL
eukprot:gene36218-47108_t